MRKLTCVLCVILSVSIILVSFSGCSQASDVTATTTPQPEKSPTAAISATEPPSATEQPVSDGVYSDMDGLTVNIMRYEYAKFPIRSSEQKVFQWIQEATGVTVNVEAVPDSSYEDKKKILLATNNLPDVMCITIDELREYAPLGPFVDLTAYMQSGDMPAYSEALSKIKESPYLTVEGKNYSFAKICYELMPGGYYPIIRMDLLEKTWNFSAGHY